MNPIILIGCGKTKITSDKKVRADDLYTGGLFKARRAYAEARTPHWWILSAKYGLVNPWTEIATYDLTLADLQPADIACWPLAVIHELITQVVEADQPIKGIQIEIHAGENYAGPLVDVFRAIGVFPSRPVEGLGIGEQLAWYKQAKHNAGLGIAGPGMPP